MMISTCQGFVFGLFLKWFCGAVSLLLGDDTHF